MIKVFYDENIKKLEVKVLLGSEKKAEQILNELLLINKAVLNEVALRYFNGLSIEERVKTINIMKRLIAEMLEEQETNFCGYTEKYN